MGLLYFYLLNSFISQSATSVQFHTYCFAHSDCQKSTCNRKVNDKELLQKLWVESARLVGLGHWDPITAEDTGELPLLQTQPGQK
jgi:hypothetical protein